MRKELLFLLSFMAITAAAQPKKLLGGDVSLLPSYEARHTVYKDFDGREVSFLPFVRQQGWNAIRVRLFVDPDTRRATTRTKASVRICPTSSN